MGKLLNWWKRKFQQPGDDYRRGIDLYNQGRYHEAIYIFDLVLTQGGQAKNLDFKLARFYSGQAHCTLGILAFHTGDNERAIDHLRAAVEHNPNLHGAYYYLGIALNNLDRFDQAMEIFNQALELNPDCMPVRRKMAVVFYNEARLADAEKELDKMVGRHPLWADMHYHLGMVKASEGREEDGLAEMGSALDINPQYLKARIASGMLLARTGRVEEGIEVLVQVSREHSEFPDIHYYLGLMLARVGDLEGSRKHLEKALAILPDYRSAKLGRCLIMGASGDIEGARRELDRLVADKPEDTEATPILDHIKRLDGTEGPETWVEFLDRFAEKARINLPSRIEIIPDFSEIATLFSPAKHRNLYLSLIEVYESSVEANEGYADLYHNLGQLYAQLDIHDKAISNLRRAVEINPDFTGARIHLYRTMVEVNMLTEAEEQTAILLEQGVNFPDLFLDRGRILIDLNRAEEATAELTKAMEINPRLADAYWLASLLAEKQGDKARAIEIIQAYPELNENTQTALTLQRRLERLRG